jgi:RNA polymerase sigma factor (sigma-70 family)
VRRYRERGRKKGTLAALPSIGRATQVEPPVTNLETAACGDLYERHSERLLRYCLFLLGGRREEAEDAVQITFVNALQALKRGVRPSAEAAWLRTIARNVCFSRREAIQRRQALETTCDPQFLSDVAVAREDDSEDAAHFREALARLPETQKRAILLREWQGLSYSEIAEELGLTLAAVETLIFRARRALAEEIARVAGRKPRSRLASIFDLSALIGSIKSGFTAWTAAKAVAVTVAAVVGATTLAGAVVAYETGNDEPSPRPRAQAVAPGEGVQSPSAQSDQAGTASPRGDEGASTGHAGRPLPTSALEAAEGPGAGPAVPGPGSNPAEEASAGSNPAGGSVSEPSAATPPPPKDALPVRPTRARKTTGKVGKLVGDVTNLVPATVGNLGNTVDDVTDVLPDSLAGVEEIVDGTTAAVTGLVDETVPGVVSGVTDALPSLPAPPTSPQQPAQTPPPPAPPAPPSGVGTVVNGLLPRL